MEIIRGVRNLKPHHRESVVTIGNFDGVHRGHQAILSRVRERADALGKPSMLICFEPQPKEFFDTFNAPARLTRFREKVIQLGKHGVDLVLCFKFDEATRSMPASRFVEILGKDIGASALFVGDDFRFGADRSGDFALLQQAGADYGFDVTDMKTIAFDDDRVSSTRIRECLQEGDLDEAEALLGRPYSIVGKVVHGRRLGRELGWPTANIQLHRYRAPIDGVYAVEVTGLDRSYQGVANVGVRPTLNDGNLKPLLEVHLFDFEGQIYGQTVEVLFRAKIREEFRFDGLDALKAQIQRDVDNALDFFEGRAAT